MDLEALDLFVSVAKAGSYAAVARDRRIDPSSVSRMMTALERDLGIRLFQRTTRQIALTDSGAVFLARIAPLVEEIRLARLAARDASSQPRGVLRVTASNAFGLSCVVPILPEFCAAYPELTVDLQLTDQIVDLIAERIDVAIRLGVLADSGLVARSLMPVRYVVCAGPTYLARAGRPRIPVEIAGHACIMFALPGFRTRWIFKDVTGAISEVAVSGPVILTNALAIQHCAVNGMGIALLPSWLIAPDLAAGRLINLFPDYAVTATDFSTAAWCVYPSSTYVPTKVRVFIDHLSRGLSPPAP